MSDVISRPFGPEGYTPQRLKHWRVEFLFLVTIRVVERKRQLKIRDRKAQMLAKRFMSMQGRRHEILCTKLCFIWWGGGGADS